MYPLHESDPGVRELPVLFLPEEEAEDEMIEGEAEAELHLESPLLMI